MCKKKIMYRKGTQGKYFLFRDYPGFTKIICIYAKRSLFDIIHLFQMVRVRVRDKINWYKDKTHLKIEFPYKQYNKLIVKAKFFF